MKTKFKKQWTQAVAIAAAAVCAVTATCTGVTINHADAADETYAASLYATTSNWVVNHYSTSDTNSVELTGDGNYTIAFTNDGWAATESWTDFKLVLFQPYDDTTKANTYSEDNVTINSITIGDTVYDAPVGTFKQSCWTFHDSGTDGEDWTADDVYSWAVEVAFDYSEFPVAAIGDAIAIDFTIGEAGEETTTTTTTTTTASSEDVTTTTTTETSDSSEDTTSTTTTTETSDSSEDTTSTTTTTEVSDSSEDTTTTTTTTTTTKATTTTTSTTTKATTTTASVTLETSIDFTQEKQDDEEGDYNAYVEFDPKGADRVKVVVKISSSDTEATLSYGCWNVAEQKWYDNQYKVNVPTDKIITYTAAVPSQVDNTMKISVYYPKAAYVTIQEVVLIYDEAPVVTTTTEFESDLTFETVTIGEATNKIDMLDRCYIIETVKGTPGYTISGGIYSGTSKDEYYLNEEWEEVVGDSCIIVKEYELRGQASATYGIFYNGKGTTNLTSAEVNIQTFYTGDASMNGKVNASDVRAIVNYLKSRESEIVDAKEVLCDYDDNGEVSLLDAVTLTKTLLGSYTTQSLNS